MYKNIFCLIIIMLLIVPLSANEARPPRHFRDLNKEQTFPVRNRDIIWQDDLEGTQEPWQSESGWMLSSSSFHSPVHAWWIDDEPDNSGLNHLISPLIQLPENWLELTLEYWYYSDLIDSDGDGNNLLDDYWMLYITDPDQAIAWHSSSVNGYLEGNSWYAGSDETETYGNASAYYLYMPPFTLPPANAAQLDCLLDYNIESPSGASSPYDGWDVANAQITTDNWLTYEFLQDTAYPYNVQVGYAGYYNSGNAADTLYYPGWAGSNANGWFAASFNLDAYLGETISIRFCLNTDAMNVAGGFWVDNVELIVNNSTLFSDYDEENLLPDESLLNWQRLAIDYGTSSGWSESPEYDISDFAGQNVHLRLTTRLDDNYDGGDGTGFWLDDISINGSNYSVYDGAALFTVVPYPTTAGVTIHPGIVYGNAGQFNINPELRLDVEDLGGDYDYYALAPGEILPGQNELGWLTPLTGFTLESGTYNFTGKVLAAGDLNTTNNQFTFENIQINQLGVYEFGFNSRIWDGSFVSSTACGTYFDPFTQGLLSDLFYLNCVKLLLINDGNSDFPTETFDISIWEAIDDL
ncbi:MAG: immune inhibitor A, partial [Candidatus Cloacimonetes bacterium]|nr:immune inhibitor A [Candidatus Cloacimonadota bacterium]